MAKQTQHVQKHNSENQAVVMGGQNNTGLLQCDIPFIILLLIFPHFRSFQLKNRSYMVYGSDSVHM